MVVICAMPVFRVGWNADYRSRFHQNRLLFPLLVPASAAGADQNLTTALISLMNMPVVFVAWFKGDVVDSISSGRTIALAFKAGSKFYVFFTNLVSNGSLVFFFGLQGTGINFFRQTEGRPRLWSASIHCRMRNGTAHFISGHPLFFCILNMVGQRTVCDALAG